MEMAYPQERVAGRQQGEITALRILACVLTLCAASCGTGQPQPVRTGADLLLESSLPLLRGKRIGLVANHTALLADGRHLADVLAERDDMTLAALFAPEHGIRGDTTGPVLDTVDRTTGIPVYSLYGVSRRPAASTLRGLDVLVFDIQDVGARFYTYISTLGRVMEAAAEEGLPLIVCDRPNPITGLHVEGPVAEERLRSFVAFAPIPIVHGMTVGELATMYNAEGWLAGGVRANLTVVRLHGWMRGRWYDQTGLPWVRPSPNMATLGTAVVYPGTCLLEGTNVSEGRGTEHPFELIGAPWLESESVVRGLRSERLPGVQFDTTSFFPVRTRHNVSGPKYEGRHCQGIFLRITDRNVFQPVRTGIALLRAIRAAHPDSLVWRLPAFDRLAGTAELRSLIDRHAPLDSIEASWRGQLAGFKAARLSCLLYDE